MRTTAAGLKRYCAACWASCRVWYAVRMRQSRSIYSVAFGLIAVVSVTSPASARDCLKGIRAALLSGRFSGSTDCLNDELIVRRLGQVRTPRATLTIYDYKYRLTPRCNDCAIHGGHRVIFMERGRYLGQFRSDFVNVSIRQGKLVLTPDGSLGSPAGKGVTIKFTRRTRPRPALVNGEVLTFFR
jgi:hypothetical protein